MKTKQSPEIQFHWVETRRDKIKQLITDILLELHVDEDRWDKASIAILKLIDFLEDNE